VFVMLSAIKHIHGMPNSSVVTAGSAVLEGQRRIMRGWRCCRSLYELWGASISWPQASSGALTASAVPGTIAEQASVTLGWWLRSVLLAVMECMLEQHVLRPRHTWCSILQQHYEVQRAITMPRPQGINFSMARNFENVTGQTETG
jgi:hypothetical protein